MSTKTLVKRPLEPKSVTARELIITLHGYAENRERAIKVYTNYTTSQKLSAIADIYEMLEKALQCVSDKEATKHILKTALNFHYIAPTGKHKDFADWYLKIEAIMNAGREYLGWQKQ